MRAIILVAGQGKRLRPLTDDRPKCLIELVGRSLLDRQLAVLREAGVGPILLVGGYRADRLVGTGVELRVNPRYEETNMVATLFCAEDWIKDTEDLLVAYGDIVYEPRVLDALLRCDAPLATTIDRQWLRLWQLRMDNVLSDAETLKLVDGDRIVEIGKVASSLDEIQGQYMGLIKIRRNYVRTVRDAWHRLDRSALYDGKNVDNMYMTSFLQHLIDNGLDLRAAFTDNGWLEVDSVEDLRRYESMHRDGTLTTFIDLGR